jgi:8-oxo-dGTP pyrophosphatase MutT (NUDIX family)
VSYASPPPKGLPPSQHEAPAASGETAPSGPVRAAGGVVWRRVPTGLEIVLVHRPAYDDWALPKGKAKPLESDEVTALREVKEETGLVCRLGPPLPSTTYLDADGRNKVVRYWAMTVVPGRAAGHGAQDLLPAPSGQHEVDEVRWSALPAARQRLSYARDVVVLDAFEEMVSRSEVRRQKVDDIAKAEPQGDEAD